MSGEDSERRLLRLRGWGREGGFLGRSVARRKTQRPAIPAGEGERNGVDAMRRAAALYLASRESQSRDLAWLELPRNGRGGGDIMLFTRRGAWLLGFARARRRPAPALTRFAGQIRALGHSCRIIHAETPAHAVELLARLLDGEGVGGR